MSLEFNPEKPDSILKHDVEKRGFVTVPLDYSNSDSDQKIRIFYRLIPADHCNVEDTSKPTLVVVNGGPGLPSSGYRAYNYDYSKEIDERKQDQIAALTKYFRVLIMDHRGTAGNSTSLNMDAEPLDYKAISRYFSADSIAKDQEQVIKSVLKNEPFYMAVQSFGGIVGFQYMWQSDIKTKPKGIIFACAATPFEDGYEFSIQRRKSQYELNRQLQKSIPNIENEVSELKAHFKALGIDPNKVNTLWAELGHGVDGVWQANFLKDMHILLTWNKAQIESYLASTLGTPHLLNYILSSSNMTPGYTDATMAERVMKEFPFEPWMFDEYSTFADAAKRSDRCDVIQMIDANPPESIRFGTVEENKKAINQVPALFTFGDNDSMTPADACKEHVRTHFYIENKTQIMMLPGGHGATFTPRGAKALNQWIANISPKVGNSIWANANQAKAQEPCVREEYSVAPSAI